MKAQMLFGDYKRLVNATKKFVAPSPHRPGFDYIRIDFMSGTQVARASATDGYGASIEYATAICSEDFTAYVKPYFPPGRSDEPVVITLEGGHLNMALGWRSFGFAQPTVAADNRIAIIETAISDNPEFRIGFDPARMAVAMEAAKTSGGYKGQPVIIEFTNPLSPAVVRQGKNLRLVLPVRLNREDA